MTTSVVLIRNSDGLLMSLVFMMLTLSLSAWKVRPLLRMSSLASSVVSVMKAKSLSVSDLVRERISTSRPS